MNSPALGVDVVDILAPSLPEKEQAFEDQLTQKLIVTFFVSLLVSNLIMAGLDRNRRG